jgi:beta-lactamase class A
LRKSDSLSQALEDALMGILRPLPLHCSLRLEIATLTDTHLLVSYHSDAIVGAASIIKLPILVCVCYLVEKGQLSWDRPIPLTVWPPHGTGLLEHLDTSRAWSVKDLCTLMMGVSDNMACNQLMEVIGVPRLNTILSGLGYKSTQVRRRMMDRQPLAEGVDNTVSADEIAGMLTLAFQHRLVSEDVSRRVLKFLELNQLKDLLAWPLPGSARLAGKTGGMPGSLLDAELVVTSQERAYVLCVFMAGFDRASTAKRSMADISDVVYDMIADELDASTGALQLPASFQS